MTHEVIAMINGTPTFKVPLDEILAKLDMGWAIKLLSPEKYISERQIAWWKGVLLPALSEDTGDSKEYWETRLKLAVKPDQFVPFYITIGKQIFPCIPSITKLSRKQMGELMEGSVDHLRDEKLYHDQFLWVTMPDPELRSK